MASSTYEIAAMVMSYWFAALSLFLLYKLVRSVLKDYRRQRTRHKVGANYALGLIEVVWPETDKYGKPHPLYGKRFALKRENTIGSASSADIRLKEDTIAPAQATIYQKDNRVMLADAGSRSGVGLNGYKLTDDTALVDGDEIMLGDVVLLLHIKGGTASGRRDVAARRDAESAPAEHDCNDFAAESEGRDGGEYDDEYRDDNDGEYDEYSDEEEYSSETRDTAEHGRGEYRDWEHYTDEYDEEYPVRHDNVEFDSRDGQRSSASSMYGESDDGYSYGRAYDPFDEDEDGEENADDADNADDIDFGSAKGGSKKRRRRIWGRRGR